MGLILINPNQKQKLPHQVLNCGNPSNALNQGIAIAIPNKHLE